MTDQPLSDLELKGLAMEYRPLEGDDLLPQHLRQAHIDLRRLIAEVRRLQRTLAMALAEVDRHVTALGGDTT